MVLRSWGSLKVGHAICRMFSLRWFLDWKTQNLNEALNAMFWERVLKGVFVVLANGTFRSWLVVKISKDYRKNLIEFCSRFVLGTIEIMKEICITLRGVMCIKTSSVWSFFVGQCFYFLKYKFLTRLESYKEGIQATNDGGKRGYRRYTNFAVERHFRSSAPGNMTILSLSFISQWKNTYLLNCLWWETCNTLLQWYIYVIVKNPKTVWP